MFEKEAEEYSNNLLKDVNCNIGNPRVRQINSIDVENAFKDGAEFGYNKANEWHTPEEEPKPIGRYATQRYPQIPCLVEIKNYGYGVRYWNVKEKCWDGEDCDDYYCDMDKVTRWAYIEEEA